MQQSLSKAFVRSARDHFKMLDIGASHLVEPRTGDSDEAVSSSALVSLR